MVGWSELTHLRYHLSVLSGLSCPVWLIDAPPDFVLLGLANRCAPPTERDFFHQIRVEGEAKVRKGWRKGVETITNVGGFAFTSEVSVIGLSILCHPLRPNL